MKLNNFQRKALVFIRDNPGQQADALARHLWPDSNMHRRVSNQGHGACRGKAAWLTGGSYAGKLRVMGLVTNRHIEGSSAIGYWITQEGRDALKNG